MTEQELAGWESAAMQNLGPVLSEAQHDAVWAAILAHREHKDTGKLAGELRKAVGGNSPQASDILERAIDRLPKPAAKVSVRPPAPAKE